MNKYMNNILNFQDNADKNHKRSPFEVLREENKQLRAKLELARETCYQLLNLLDGLTIDDNPDLVYVRLLLEISKIITNLLQKLEK